MANHIESGSGDVLVLQHGFLCGADYWHYQLEALSGHYRVIAPNLPGFAGREAAGLNRIEDFAASTVAVLDDLGVRQFHLLGHSMGGMIAQQIALDYSDRVDRLILFGTGPDGSLPGRFEPIAVSRERIQREGPGKTVPSTVASWFMRGADDPHYPDCLALARSVSAETMLESYAAWERWNVINRLGEIRARTLVLWGDRDASYPWHQPQALWQGIADSALGVIPGASHNTHLEQPALFNQMVGGFLKS